MKVMSVQNTGILSGIDDYFDGKFSRRNFADCCYSTKSRNTTLAVSAIFAQLVACVIHTLLPRFVCIQGQ